MSRLRCGPGGAPGCSKARRIYDRDDVIVVVADLEPDRTRDTRIHLRMPELGLDWPDRPTI